MLHGIDITVWLTQCIFSCMESLKYPSWRFYWDSWKKEEILFVTANPMVAKFLTLLCVASQAANWFSPYNSLLVPSTVFFSPRFFHKHIRLQTALVPVWLAKTKTLGHSLDTLFSSTWQQKSSAPPVGQTGQGWPKLFKISQLFFLGVFHALCSLHFTLAWPCHL